MNTEERPRRLMVTATGIDGLTIGGITLPVDIGATTTQMFTLNLRAPADKTQKGSTRIEFHIAPINAQDANNPDDFSLREKSVFFKR